MEPSATLHTWMQCNAMQHEDGILSTGRQTGVAVLVVAVADLDFEGDEFCSSDSQSLMN